LAGIAAARKAGLRPVKVNTVVMRGINDDEIAAFAALTADGWHVRFIEVMPFGSGSGSLLVSAAEILAQIPGLVPDNTVAGFGPARMYRLPGATGTVSVISPVTDHFCAGCNRLRLTADGKLRPCLLADGEVDLRPALRTTQDPAGLARLILEAVANKPEHHWLAAGQSPQNRTMAQIGG
jgi:cyclic pyranopterin phosphate synthase